LGNFYLGKLQGQAGKLARHLNQAIIALRKTKKNIVGKTERNIMEMTEENIVGQVVAPVATMFWVTWLTGVVGGYSRLK